MTNNNSNPQAVNGKNSSAWMTHSEIRQFLAEFHETQQQNKKEQAEFRDFSLVVSMACVEICLATGIKPPGFTEGDLSVAHVWLEQTLMNCLVNSDE